MYSKNTLHLIESRPQRLKTVHKYSRTLISLLQQTSIKLRCQLLSYKTPKLFTASTYARKTTFARIATDARITTDTRIPTIARIITIARINLNAMSRVVYTRRLIRESLRFYRVR